MVIIGIDPHPTSLTLAAMEHTGEVLLNRTIPNDQEAVPFVLELARGFPDRRWAIEGAGNRYVTELIRALATLGEDITDVPPGLTSQYRSKRGRKKTDEMDAGVIAKAALANPALPRYTRNEPSSTSSASPAPGNASPSTCSPNALPCQPAVRVAHPERARGRRDVPSGRHRGDHSAHPSASLQQLDPGSCASTAWGRSLAAWCWPKPATSSASAAPTRSPRIAAPRPSSVAAAS